MLKKHLCSLVLCMAFSSYVARPIVHFLIIFGDNDKDFYLYILSHSILHESVETLDQNYDRSERNIRYLSA